MYISCVCACLTVSRYVLKIHECTRPKPYLTVEAVAEYWIKEQQVTKAFVSQRVCSREDYHHMTIMNHKELAEVRETNPTLQAADLVAEMVATGVGQDWVARGVGLSAEPDKSNSVIYVVCASESIQAFRKKWNLPMKHLHITIGFQKTDIFDVDKSKVWTQAQLDKAWT